VKTRELWKIGRGGTEILKEEGRNWDIFRGEEEEHGIFEEDGRSR
jgi:hypothetical protein